MGAKLCKEDKVFDGTSNQTNRRIEMEIKRNLLEESRSIKILLLGTFFHAFK